MADLLDTTAPAGRTRPARPVPRWARGARRHPRAAPLALPLVVLSSRPRAAAALPRRPAGSPARRLADAAREHLAPLGRAVRASLDADLAALAVAALMLGTLLYV